MILNLGRFGPGGLVQDWFLEGGPVFLPSRDRTGQAVQSASLYYNINPWILVNFRWNISLPSWTTCPLSLPPKMWISTSCPQSSVSLTWLWATRLCHLQKGLEHFIVL